MGRRRSQRFSIQLPAEVALTCQPPRAARLCDLSMGGAMVVSPLKAEFGTVVRVRFLLTDVVCEAVGRVLRVVRLKQVDLALGEEHGIAFEFAQMNPGFEHFLRNLEGSSGAERDIFLRDVAALTVELVSV